MSVFPTGIWTKNRKGREETIIPVIGLAERDCRFTNGNAGTCNTFTKISRMMGQYMNFL